MKHAITAMLTFGMFIAGCSSETEDEKSGEEYEGYYYDAPYYEGDGGAEDVQSEAAALTNVAASAGTDTMSTTTNCDYDAYRACRTLTPPSKRSRCVLVCN